MKGSFTGDSVTLQPPATGSTKFRPMRCWRLEKRPHCTFDFFVFFCKVLCANDQRKEMDYGVTWDYKASSENILSHCIFAMSVVWSYPKCPGSKHTQHIQSRLSSVFLSSEPEMGW